MGKKIEINLVEHLDVKNVMEQITYDLNMAKNTGKCTYQELENALIHLERARGAFTALFLLDLLPEEFERATVEDINRITDKLTDIREKRTRSCCSTNEKRAQMRWRSQKGS